MSKLILVGLVAGIFLVGCGNQGNGADETAANAKSFKGMSGSGKHLPGMMSASSGGAAPKTGAAPSSGATNE